MPKLCGVLVLWASCAMAQTVNGTVLDAGSGLGVRGVRVDLFKGGSAAYDTTTDERGHFRFDSIGEGDYTDRYRAAPDHWLTAGYSDIHYFHVSAGSAVNLETRVMPYSKVSGRVVDGRGQGVANAALELTGSGMLIQGRTFLRTSWGGGGGGDLSMGPIGMSLQGKTDSDGKFEVQVMPGKYGLAVTPPQNLRPPEPADDGSVMAWKKTYYPGVVAAETASKIAVFPGAEVAGIELKLRAAATHAVRGVVLNPDGTPAPKVKVALDGGANPVSAESKPDGTFDVPSVAEGEWRYSAQSQIGSVKLRAVGWIDVAKHDFEGVKVRLSAPLTVRGKVGGPSVRGAVAPKTQPLIFLIGSSGARNPVLGDGLAILAEPDAAGVFLLKDAYPGVYRIEPFALRAQPPYYLDSILIGTGDLMTGDVEISADAEITVIYKSDGGSVRGKAENCASGGVLLVPSDPVRRRPAFFRSGPCDASDGYEIEALRPGDYYALAFAGNGPVLAVDDLLINQGVKVTIRAGEGTTADLRAVTKPIY